MEIKKMKTFFVGLLLGLLIMGLMASGAFFYSVWLNKQGGEEGILAPKTREIVTEESVVTRVVEEVTPGVVTISMSKIQVVNDPFADFDFFFDFFGQPQNTQKEEKIEQDIGTGFIISEDGLIVTNKHVVADIEAKYKVVIGTDEVVEVKNIYRDPLTDLAILKVEKEGLIPIAMGDSDNLKVGQLVVAIGTALGEFRSTVTTGVISGLGRGIVAGSAFAGSEKLENVIQTDAAINPGNSGGPLLNSSGEVIGVNVAVSASGENIGFALPINFVKESINNFKTTGEFDRPYIGVVYQMISRQAALLNEVPQGAYIQEVVKDSPAEKAGILAGDIVTEIAGIKLNDEKDNSFINVINKHKIGDEITVKIYRGNEEKLLKVKLEKRELK